MGVLERIGLNQCISLLLWPPEGRGNYPPKGKGGALAPGGPARLFSRLLPEIVHLAADAHEHIHLVPPQAGLAEKTAQGHQEVVGIVAFEIVDGEERFFEPGVEQGLFLVRDAARLLAGIVAERRLRVHAADRLHAFVGKDEDGLRQIERRSLSCGGDGYEALALLDVGIAQAAILAAEDDGDPAAFVEQGRDFPGGLFRRQQPAPPAARAGSGAEGQDVGGERVAERRFDLNGVEQGLALGRGQRPGFFLIPPRGADERQAPAAPCLAQARAAMPMFSGNLVPP